MPSLPCGAIALDDSIGQGLRGFARFFRLLLAFLAVFVSAGQKPNVFANQFMIASENIGCGCRIEMADMGRIRDVVNGSRNVIRFFQAKFCRIKLSSIKP